MCLDEFLLLFDERFVNVRDDTTASNAIKQRDERQPNTNKHKHVKCQRDVRGFDQRIELFVTTNGQLQVTRCDTLHFQIFGSVASQLEHFGGQILQNGRSVHGGSRTDTAARSRTRFQETVDTTDRKLQTGTYGA